MKLVITFAVQIKKEIKEMKRTKHLITSLLVFLHVPSFANMSTPDNANQGAVWTFKTDGSNNATLLSISSDFDGTNNTLIIPAYVTDDANNPTKYQVTVFGESGLSLSGGNTNSFGGNANIKSVNFTNAINLVSISDVAFNSGTTDTKLDGVHQLEQTDLDLFACTKLRYIGVLAFHCQMGLKGTLILPASIEKIAGGTNGLGAFRYTAFSSIKFVSPSNLTYLGIEAFSDMPNLSGDIVIHIGYDFTIDDGVFMNDAKLRSVTFRSPNLYHLEFDDSRYDNAYLVNEGVFKNCRSLEYVDMSSVTIDGWIPELTRTATSDILNYAFNGMPSHTIVYLPPIDEEFITNDTDFGYWTELIDENSEVCNYVYTTDYGSTWTCPNLSIEDGENYFFPISFTATKATYNANNNDLSTLATSKRTFSGQINSLDGRTPLSTLSSIYLPYAFTLPTNMVGYKFYKKEENTFIFQELETGTKLAANVPYLIRTTDGNNGELPVATDVWVNRSFIGVDHSSYDSPTLVPELLDVNNVSNNPYTTSVGDKNGVRWQFCGTTEAVSNSMAASWGAYNLSGNTWTPITSANANGYIGQFRAFIAPADKTKVGTKPVFTFELQGLDGTVTDIDRIDEIPNSVETRIYNISGQYMGKDFNTLPKGIYVVNGKKVIK